MDKTSKIMTFWTFLNIFHCDYEPFSIKTAFFLQCFLWCLASRPLLSCLCSAIDVFLHEFSYLTLRANYSCSFLSLSLRNVLKESHNEEISTLMNVYEELYMRFLSPFRPSRTFLSELESSCFLIVFNNP